MLRRELTRFGLLSLVFALLMTGCAGLTSDPTPYPGEVDWELAVEILNSGEVEMVAQTHSRDVILTLKDGSEIRTVEPGMDDIFREVEKCGSLCSDLVLATE